MPIDDIKFNEQGLVSAVIQDYKTGEVLMQAYMNKESLEKTLETGRSWFYSRSRKELWEKGATSGCIQTVKELFYDCDGDSLLLKVEQAGAACHTGNRSCFYRSLLKSEEGVEAADIGKVIADLYSKVEDRRKNPVEGSYTCYLFNKGIDKICKKIGEESTEVVIAVKNESKEEAVYEISDLIYHLTVLMNYMDITYEDVGIELKKRFK